MSERHTPEEREMLDVFMKAQATPEGEMFSDNILRGIKAVLALSEMGEPKTVPLCSVLDCLHDLGFKCGRPECPSAAPNAAPSCVVVVPKEPTVEMMLAALSEHRQWESEHSPTSAYWPRIYKAMLNASPSER